MEMGLPLFRMEAANNKVMEGRQRQVPIIWLRHRLTIPKRMGMDTIMGNQRITATVTKVLTRIQW